MEASKIIATHFPRFSLYTFKPCNKNFLLKTTNIRDVEIKSNVTDENINNLHVD